MRSFARVVQTYVDAHAAGSQADRRRVFAQMAATDISELFSSHNWRFAERQVDVALWGTQTVTMTSVSSTLVNVSDTTDEKWVGQDIIISGSTTPHLIMRLNTAGSFIINPAYTGTAIASGTTATIRQIRVGLPIHFGALLDPVLRDSSTSRPTSPEEMTMVMRGTWSSGYCHSVQGKSILVWPAQSGRLYFRYKYVPESPFEYGEGTEAVVKTTEKDLIIGAGALWSQLPDSGYDTVFESTDNISRGMPISYGVVKVLTDTTLRINSDWKSPLDTSFSYRISTDLNMPQYLDQCVRAKAEWRADKRNHEHFYECVLRAIGADSAIEQRWNRYAEHGTVAMITGTRDNP